MSEKQKWLLVPIKLDEFSVYQCDGTFAGSQPFLKGEGETFELKPDEGCYIGSYLDGRRTFIPFSTLYTRGVLVEPSETGEIIIDMVLPTGEQNG